MQSIEDESMTSKRMQKRIRKTAALLLLCLLTVVWSVRPAAAVAQIKVGETCLLTVEDKFETKPLAGVSFSLYRVSDVSNLGRFTLTADFAGSGAELNDVTEASQWQTLADELKQ